MIPLVRKARLKKPKANPDVSGRLVILLDIQQEQQLNPQLKLRAIRAKVAPTKKVVDHAKTELSCPFVVQSS
jgi:hypothetical protein